MAEVTAHVDAPESQIGLSEHDQKMIALADGVEQQAPEQVQPDRPSWLPEKFKTPEDLAASYQELEKKLGGKQEPDSQGSATADVEKAAAGLTQESIDKYTSEISSDGKLSDASYQELEKVGLTKDIVDAYIAGQQAVAEQTSNELFSVAGGKDNYTKVATWAHTNVDPSLVETYNAAIDSGNLATAKSLMTIINKLYVEANGTEGVRVEGQAAKSSNDVFSSWAEVSTAMADPRYKGNLRDEGYVRTVEAKLSRSNI